MRAHRVPALAVLAWGLLALATAPTEAALVAYYPMDDMTGTTLTEAVSANSATMSTDIGLPGISVAGKYGNAINFSDTYYAEIASASVFTTRSDLTLSFWVQDYTNGANDMVLAASNGTTGKRIQLQMQTGRIYSYEYSTGYGTTFNNGTAAQTWVAGTWHHVAIVAKDQLATIYKDGVHVGTWNGWESPSNPAYAGALTRAFIGGVVLGDTGSPYAFSAKLDEVALYDYRLAKNQVVALYEALDASIVYNLPAPNYGDAAYVGVDNTTKWQWRDPSVVKPNDADNIIGTDGYSMLDTPGTYVDLPDYITSITKNGGVGVAGEYGMLQNPADLKDIKLAWNAADATIVRNGMSPAFRLTVGCPAGSNPAAQTDYEVYVDVNGELTVKHIAPAYDARKPYLSYETFLIPAGTADIKVRSTRGICLVAFDSVPPVEGTAVPEPSSLALLLGAVGGGTIFGGGRAFRKRLPLVLLAVLFMGTATANAGIVAYYNLDETSGSALADATALNPATLKDATKTAVDVSTVGASAAGKFGTAINFQNKYSGDVFADIGSSLSSLSDYTLSAWVCDYTGLASKMVFTWYQSGPEHIQDVLQVNTVCTYEAKAGTPAWSLNNSSRLTWTPGQWYNVAWVVKSGMMTFYRDGTPLGVHNNAVSPNQLVAGPDGCIMQLGGLVSDSRYMFDGKIDEAVIFDQALAPNQIRHLASATSAGASGSLPTAVWPDPASFPKATSVGTERTTKWLWRDSTVAKPNDLDGDNVYGTDGYYVADMTTPLAALPAYIRSVDRPMDWARTGEYGVLEDPASPGDPMIATALAKGYTTIHRNGATDAFRLTIGLAALNYLTDDNVTVKVLLGEDSEGIDVVLNDPIYLPEDAQLTYWSLDIPAGSEDILIGMPVEGDYVLSPKIALLAFDGVAAPIPGDATGDKKVDAADAQALAANWGVTTGATWQMGDFDGNGAINAADASIMAANWHYGVSAGEATAVPEPSAALGLAGLLAAGLFGLRFRHGRD